ncbi:transglutaminase-like domain-containing protein [Fodinicola feengrottensis]|uniref:transglutaminase-like domain-containing protein n=1 Tax=Fodinicola feengrottensis TaxID=435914 RepID=UPI0013D1FBCD|nr:transglutaminase-like domain-containing protein [Fodinicola feengrottensis]
MKTRLSAVPVLLAAGVAGLLFEPVFGLWALIRPIAAVLVACYLAVELALRVPKLAQWRALLVLVGGLLAAVYSELWATTLGGLPTGATVRAIAAGVTQSWQLTLQSTWPARPDPELLLFVPLAVVAAALLGLELLRWAPAALLPSLAVVGLSQAFVPLTGAAATGGALCYAVAAAALLVASRRSVGHRTPLRVWMWAPTAILGVLGALAMMVADPVTPTVSLRQIQASAALPEDVASPLDEVAADLRQPDLPVFSYTSKTQVDRWRLAVLDGFDGAGWSFTATFRRMGSTVSLPSTITAPTVRRDASVFLPEPSDPWVPSQPLPTSVAGAAPLLDQESGVLVVPHRDGPVHYDLSWKEPKVDAVQLGGAAIDPHAAGGFAGLGAVPPEISTLAIKATDGMRPSFQAALVLERYLSENYKVATGTDLPTGAGWPQLSTFLLQTKRGTSVQFAASYVVLARILGIPARIAVGYRGEQALTGGTTIVRNRDVLAWPEVAVAGVGWVPLDPTRTASGSSVTGAAYTKTDTGRPPPRPPRPGRSCRRRRTSRIRRCPLSPSVARSTSRASLSWLFLLFS